MIRFVIEIKNRTSLLFLSWLSLFFVFYYYKFVFVLLIIFSNYNFSNTILSYFIFTSVQELFITYLSLCIFLTNHIFYYIIFYHFTCYFSWSLFKSEYVILKNFFFLSISLFASSILFFQLILMPAVLNFFLSFQVSMAVDLFFEAKLSEFLIFYTTTFKNCFFIFQVFGILILLTSYFNFTNEFLRITRKSFYLVLLVFSTILTPPDVYSQLMSFLTFVVCFELFVFKSFLKKNKI